MSPRAVTEGLRRRVILTVVLVAGLCTASPALGAGTLTLSNLRLEPDPEELRQRGVLAVAKTYPSFKVAGKEREGHALFDGVDGFSSFWNDLTGFLAEALKP